MSNAHTIPAPELVEIGDAAALTLGEGGTLVDKCECSFPVEKLPADQQPQT